eukprot:5508066-Amphidinium_carterae.1
MGMLPSHVSTSDLIGSDSVLLPGSWGGAERLDDDGASQDLEEGRNAANDGREDLDITSPRRTLEGAPRVDVDVEDDASEVDSMAPVEEAQGGASHLEGVVRDGWFEHEVSSSHKHQTRQSARLASK